jgi:uncharacterized membrane protein
MKRKTMYWTLGVLLITGVLLSFGFRQFSPEIKEKMLDLKIAVISEELQLNAAQKEELNRLKPAIQEKMEQMHQNRNAFKEKVKKLLLSDTLDQAALNQAISEHRASMDDMIQFAVTQLASFHSTLTPEQKTKLVEKLDKFCHHHRP